MGSSKQSLKSGIFQTTAVLSNPDRKSSHDREKIKETVLESLEPIL